MMGECQYCLYIRELIPNKAVCARCASHYASAHWNDYLQHIAHGEHMDTTLDVNALVQEYIAARDLKAEIDKQWAERKKKVTDVMDKIEGQLQEFLDANNVTTLRTASGTCYTTVKRRASVQDGEAFMEFVKAGNWDLIERRANSTAVEDWVNKHDSLPPGVNLSSYQTVGVRRTNGKTD